MSIGDIIRSVFEFALIVITIVALINEPKIAVFERKFARACVIHLRNRRRRKQTATASVSGVQRKDMETTKNDVIEPKLTLIECGYRVA